MCINPSFIWLQRGPGHVRQSVPCRQCWQCKQRRKDDYAGRAMCEAAYSKATVALTLTYRPRDDLAEKVVTPSHFQAFVRSLRRRGLKVRYIGVGEYGDLRSRAHFHCILFFSANIPDWPQHERFWCDAWPHGHLWADWSADERAVRYVTAYMMEGRNQQTWATVSKVPVVGWPFFEHRAQEMARQGVWPSSFTYLPPGVVNRTKPYMFGGATRRDFILRLVELRGHWPDFERLDPWVAQSFEKARRYALRRDYVPPAWDDIVDEWRAELAHSERIRQAEWLDRWQKRDLQRFRDLTGGDGGAWQ